MVPRKKINAVLLVLGCLSLVAAFVVRAYRGGTHAQMHGQMQHMHATMHRPAAAPASSVTSQGMSGEDIYASDCSVCHGMDGRGTVPGTPDFSDPNGVLAKSDAVLMQHIIEGFQSPNSQMAMPAKGGHPELTNEDVQRVLAYLRTTFGRR